MGRTSTDLAPAFSFLSAAWETFSTIAVSLVRMVSNALMSISATCPHLPRMSRASASRRSPRADCSFAMEPAMARTSPTFIGMWGEPSVNFFFASSISLGILQNRSMALAVWVSASLPADADVLLAPRSSSRTPVAPRWNSTPRRTEGKRSSVSGWRVTSANSSPVSAGLRDVRLVMNSRTRWDGTCDRMTGKSG